MSRETYVSLRENCLSVSFHRVNFGNLFFQALSVLADEHKMNNLLFTNDPR